MLLPVCCCALLLLHSRAWPVRWGWRADSARCIQSTSRCIVHRAHGIAAQAKLHLGKCYRDGKGTAADERLAREVRRAAAACGVRHTACDMRPLRDVDGRRPARGGHFAPRLSPTRGTTRACLRAHTAAMPQAFKEAAELEVPEAFFVLPRLPLPCPG